MRHAIVAKVMKLMDLSPKNAHPKQKKEYFCKIFNKLEIIIFCNPAKILVAKCLQFSK